MKALLHRCGIALVATFLAGPLFAADYPAPYSPPLPVAQLYDWSGFYFGGNLGYGLAKDSLGVSGFDVDGVAVPGSSFAALRPNGIIGGLQAGYNWQPAKNFVYSIETDFQWSGQKDSITAAGPVASASCFGDPNGPCSVAATGSGTLAAKIDWFGTLRGRLGFAADDVLIYGTGGFAYGSVKTSGLGAFAGTFTDATTCAGGCPASGNSFFDDTRTKLGWTVGAGVEGALPYTKNWILRAEYLYVDLGTVASSGAFNSTVSIPAIPLIQNASGTVSHSSHVTDQILRIGISYKFGG
ncbi:MAG TPA: outer membrane beta-barrel protein [Xanthobacteraceae bacterium]|nr:outer membrane beta-barrel protein [Xanthobacteraceae bacterium]